MQTRRGEEEAGHRQFGSPKNGPCGGFTFSREVHRKKLLDLTNFKFESKSRTTRCRSLQSFAIPDKAVQLQLS